MKQKLIRLIVAAMAMLMVFGAAACRTPARPPVVEPDKITVSFDLNYGAGYASPDAPGSVKVIPGEPYGDILPVPTRAGFSFVGWYLAKNPGASAEAVTTETAAQSKDHILFAKWTGDKVTLSFVLNGGNVAGNTTLDDLTVTVGSMYSAMTFPENPVRDGYTFEGWYLDPGFTDGPIAVGAVVTATTNHTLYAKWKEVKLYVDFSEEGDENFIKQLGGGQGGDYTKEIVSRIPTGKTEPVDMLKTQVIEGEDDGWWTLTYVLNGDFKKNDVAQITFDFDAADYANYFKYSNNSKVVEICFEPRGLFTNAGRVTSALTNNLTWSAPITWTTTLTDDTNAIGFFISYAYGRASTAGPTNDAHLLPAYVMDVGVKNAQRVSTVFDLNYNGAAAYQTIKYKPGNTYGSLPTPPNRIGFQFLNWNTQADGGGTDITTSSIVSGAGHTLYAKWKDVTPVPVQLSYNLKGGNVGGNAAISDETVIAGQEYGAAISGVTPQKNRFTFDGWYFDEFCINDPVSASDPVSIVKTTVYAKWKNYQRIEPLKDGGGAIIFTGDPSKTLWDYSDPLDLEYFDIGGFGWGDPSGGDNTHYLYDHDRGVYAYNAIGDSYLYLNFYCPVPAGKTITMEVEAILPGAMNANIGISLIGRRTAYLPPTNSGDREFTVATISATPTAGEWQGTKTISGAVTAGNDCYYMFLQINMSGITQKTGAMFFIRSVTIA